jgi:hypothetical protein
VVTHQLAVLGDCRGYQVCASPGSVHFRGELPRTVPATERMPSFFNTRQCVDARSCHSPVEVDRSHFEDAVDGGDRGRRIDGLSNVGFAAWGIV